MFRTITLCTVALAAFAGSAHASFSSYVIRNGSSGAPGILPNNTYVPGATEFVISQGGMKAGLGSDNLNGLTLGGVAGVGIDRHDDTTRFTAGSGPATAPYFNLWVTDGTNYAVLANEPSNGSFAAFRTTNVDGSISYSFSFADIAAEPVQVYETANGGFNSTNTWVHAAVGQTGNLLTFGDVLGLTIGAPSAAYIAGSGSIGSGAPDEIGTNAAFGFNWIFGDTLSNYVSGAEGYVVSNAFAVPAPGAVALLGLAGFSGLRRRR